MLTGWYTDTDGSLGAMKKGWVWIDRDGDGKAECYYFNTVSNGKLGALMRSGLTPDGYTVNADGAWVLNGIIQTK